MQATSSLVSIVISHGSGFHYGFVHVRQNCLQRNLTRPVYRCSPQQYHRCDVALFHVVFQLCAHRLCCYPEQAFYPISNDCVSSKPLANSHTQPQCIAILMWLPNKNGEPYGAHRILDSSPENLIERAVPLQRLYVHPNNCLPRCANSDAIPTLCTPTT